MPTTKTFNCINCGKEHTTPNKYASKAKYCSQKCQHEYQHKERVKAWDEGGKVGLRTIRRYLLEQNDCCSRCGIKDWNGEPITLEIEHIDGNSENNAKDNLTLLCPNCHSQTDTYKGRNKGNGRHYRRERYAEGKSY